MKAIFVIALLGLGLAAAQRGSCRSSGCDGESPDGGCYCDLQCSTESPSDCCFDYAAECGRQPGTRGSCRESSCDGQSPTGSCWCDDSCANQVPSDCCSDHTEICGRRTSRTSGEDGNVCLGCPAGPQTYGGARQICYCDQECKGLTDCCPSFEDNCSDDLSPGPRAAFCALLTVSQPALCGINMKKAVYLPMDTKKFGGYDHDDSTPYDCTAPPFIHEMQSALHPDGCCSDNGWWVNTYIGGGSSFCSGTAGHDFAKCHSGDRDAPWETNQFRQIYDTCVTDPEVTGDVEYCYPLGGNNGEDYNDFYVRFGCSGNAVFQQSCNDDKDCDDNNCEDNPWIRVNHGFVGPEDYQDYTAPVFEPFPSGPAPQNYGIIQSMGANVPAIPGSCHVQVDIQGYSTDCDGDGCDKAGLSDDKVRVAGVFACLDEEYNSDTIWVWETSGSIYLSSNAGGEYTFGDDGGYYVDVHDDVDDFDDHFLLGWGFFSMYSQTVAGNCGDYRLPRSLFSGDGDGDLQHGRSPPCYVTDVGSSSCTFGDGDGDVCWHCGFSYRQEDIDDYPYLAQWAQWRSYSDANLVQDHSDWLQFMAPYVTKGRSNYC